MRLCLVALLFPVLALAQVSVAVDTTADVHPISPLIYGAIGLVAKAPLPLLLLVAALGLAARARRRR